jgi:hypothetical protein
LIQTPPPLSVEEVTNFPCVLRELVSFAPSGTVAMHSHSSAILKVIKVLNKLHDCGALLDSTANKVVTLSSSSSWEGLTWFVIVVYLFRHGRPKS